MQKTFFFGGGGESACFQGVPLDKHIDFLKLFVINIAAVFPYLAKRKKATK